MSVRRSALRRSRQIPEEFPYSPHIRISISKAAADFAVRSFSRRFALPVTISNCTNNYRPVPDAGKGHPAVDLAAFAEQEDRALYREGRHAWPNVRDWLHFDDHWPPSSAFWVDGRLGRPTASAALRTGRLRVWSSGSFRQMSEIAGNPFHGDPCGLRARPARPRPRYARIPPRWKRSSVAAATHL